MVQKLPRWKDNLVEYSPAKVDKKDDKGNYGPQNINNRLQKRGAESPDLKNSIKIPERTHTTMRSESGLGDNKEPKIGFRIPQKTKKDYKNQPFEYAKASPVKRAG